MVKLTERSVEELIVFMLGTTLFVGLVLIAMMRYSAGEPGIAFADAIGAILTLALLAFVYLTRRVKLASTLISIGTVLGVMAIVLLNGSEEIYFLYPAFIAGFFPLTPNLALIVGVTAVAILTPILFAQMDIFALLKFVFSILGCILFAYTFSVIRERQRSQLLGLATKDALTGAGNRRALLEKMDEMILTTREPKHRSRCS